MNQLCIRIHPLIFRFFSHIGKGNGTPLQYSCLENPMEVITEYWIEFPVLYNRSLLVIRFTDEKVLVAQSCPTLCNPIDCSPQGYSVHGILQARILEWVAVPFCRGSSQARDWTGSPHILILWLKSPSAVILRSKITIILIIIMDFPSGSDGKESACRAGDPSSIPGSGRFQGEGNGYPFQCSCLENSMDRVTLQATVHGIAKCQTWLSD